MLPKKIATNFFLRVYMLNKTPTDRINYKHWPADATRSQSRFTHFYLFKSSVYNTCKRLTTANKMRSN